MEEMIEIKALTLLTLKPTGTEEGPQFGNIGFALQSNQQAIRDQLFQQINGKPSYTAAAHMFYLDAVAYAIASIIQHSEHHGWNTRENIIKGLTESIVEYIPIVTKNFWHEIRKTPKAGPSTN